jgi:glucose/arabinose dehydrogenase
VLLGCSDASAPREPDETGGTGNVELRLEEVARGLQNPVLVTAPPGDQRLFVVERAGRVRVLANGQLLPAPFLDITDRVRSDAERGLLSIAFHPRYTTNGYFYALYTNHDGDIRIERFQAAPDADVADPSDGTLVLSIEHSANGNHNGGLLLFGPDGLLYTGIGDAGESRNAQDLGLLLGKILRLDVDGGSPYMVPADNPFAGRADARGEIWAYGLRNPWRFAFDPDAGLLYIADVGAAAREEVNAAPILAKGVNYGWSFMEGSVCVNGGSCSHEGLTLPAVEYVHPDGCAIIGGFVYRGRSIPELAGHYLYADLCRSWIRGFRSVDGAVAYPREWDLTPIANILSFGQDGVGELYVMTAGGGVYRIVRAP